MSERILLGLYGPIATGELQRLVMACEDCYENFGKKSIFGKDKGAAARQKFDLALVKTILAFEAVGKISDHTNAELSFDAIHSAMKLAKNAWPNWPKAYKYWDDVYYQRI